MDTANKIIIYTDGAALGNPGRGGYAAVLLFNGVKKEVVDAFRMTTNNRMELLAVIRALESLKPVSHEVHVFSDSQYVCNAINKNWIHGWKKKGWVKVKNVDLWKRFIPLYEQFKPHFHWVKGHAGNPGNERCDFLATTAAQNGPHQIDVGYEDSLKNGDKLL